jgi:hypothetical protein
VDTLELRRPGREWIRLVVVDHVAHGDCEQVQIVLDAQQLQGIFAVAVDQLALELAQACYLPGDVSGVHHDRCDGDDKAEQQAQGWRALRGRRA